MASPPWPPASRALPASRLRSRKGRYHLSDPFFRFFLRFIAPNQTQIQLGSAPIWSTLQHDLRDLFERTGPLVLRELPSERRDWRVRYACFARAGFTDAACSFLQEHQGIVIDLAELERGLP